MGKHEIEGKIPYQKEHEKDKAQHMHEIKEILDGLGVRFFLGYGLVLSAVRDKRFIFSDGDIDFILMAEEVNKRKSEIIKYLNETEHFGIKTPTSQRLWCNKEINGYQSELDLYMYPEYEAWRYEITTDGYFALFPKELFENPKKIKFYGKEYLIPNPPEEYLRICYGNDWRIPLSKATVPDVTLWENLPTVETFTTVMENIGGVKNAEKGS